MKKRLIFLAVVLPVFLFVSCADALSGIFGTDKPDPGGVAFIGLTASPDNLILAPTESVTLNASKTVTWTSSNTGAATADQNGTVTGAAPGRAVITAAADDGRTGNKGNATCVFF
jgi:hypothetical protein